MDSFYHLYLLKYILPAIWVLASFVLGLIFEKIVMMRLKRLAEKTRWRGDDIVVHSIKGFSILIFTLIGIYIAIKTQDIEPGLMNNLNIAFKSIFIFIGTIIVARLSVAFINSTIKFKRMLPTSSILQNIIRIVIYIAGAIIILNNLNVSISPLLTALGVGGLAVALALQPTLSNLFSGLQIIASKQLLPGHYVSLSSGEKGYVQDITWRHTVIRALSNNMYIIPNSKISEAVITNYYTSQTEMSVLIQVGVSYSSDLEFVEKTTIEVAKKILKEIQGGKEDFEPFIRYHTFGDSSINFTVILRVKEFVDQYIVKHEFIKELHKQFKEKGIEIPFPITTVHLKEKQIER